MTRYIFLWGDGVEGWSARIPKIRKPGQYSYSTHVAVMFSLLSRIVGLLRSRQPWPAGAGPSFPVASPDFRGGWISCECLGRIYETQICTCHDEHPAPAPHPRPNPRRLLSARQPPIATSTETTNACGTYCAPGTGSSRCPLLPHPQPPAVGAQGLARSRLGRD